ncbi:MAG TPA: response regulator [Nitrososphaeraceae archaeon]|nr:response regulator [Nitrososphaeraceae archaeon]
MSIVKDSDVSIHYNALSPPPTNPKRQETITSNGLDEQRQEQSSIGKRILIVDDDPDITLTFKSGLESENEKSNRMHFEVKTYNDPAAALSEFRPHFYDLLLVDFNMPKMDGLELSDKILEQDINVKVCFVTATEVNILALKEQRPSLSLGCFIKSLSQ